MIWDKKQISTGSGRLSGNIRGLNILSDIRSDLRWPGKLQTK
jgi:hypothetical protein